MSVLGMFLGIPDTDPSGPGYECESFIIIYFCSVKARDLLYATIGGIAMGYGSVAVRSNGALTEPRFRDP